MREWSLSWNSAKEADIAEYKEEYARWQIRSGYITVKFTIWEIS